MRIDGLSGITKRPRPSGIAAKWRAFKTWAPVRAARSFLGHIGLALVCMCGIWLTEQVFHWFFPEEPKFFGWIPVKWFFDASEAGILMTFVIWGIYDAWRELMR